MFFRAWNRRPVPTRCPYRLEAGGFRHGTAYGSERLQAAWGSPPHIPIYAGKLSGQIITPVKLRFFGVILVWIMID